MMKKSFAIATFVGVAGVGGVGVHAASSISFHGSDTLFTLTQELLTTTNGNAGPLCPGAVGLTYLGGGSGTGETGLVNGVQGVAPMSRFLQGSTAGLCAAASTDGNLAQGLVFALDGVGLFAAGANGGTVACNGAAGTNAGDGGPGAACTVTVPAVGLAYDTTVNGYTFNSWKDVLKVLYAGVAHTGAASTDQGCSGGIRTFLAANYGSLFETANCTTGCTQIQHLFRRDDSSGTSDIFSQLLGLTSPNNTANAVGVTTLPSLYNLGADSFCNAIHAASGTSANTAGQSVQTLELTAWQAIVPAATVSYTGVLPYDYQDFDPIRRTCAGNGASPRSGNEQVCDPDGKLGLVLPVVDANQAGANQYGTGLACTGGFVHAVAPTVVTYTVRGAPQNVSETCPNGDDPAGGLCYVPTDVNHNPNCVNTQSNNTAPITNHTPANGLNPAAVDGRVYNKWVYNFTVGQSSNPVVATDNTNTGSGVVPATQRPIFGAYYRIHQTLTMTPGSTAVCALPDATQQIGCLVNASPCSLGYAGRSADSQAGSNSILVNALPDQQACIQNFDYPLSRKLYLDTLTGFGAAGVSGQELELAKCENSSGTIVGGSINQAVTDNGFVPLPSVGKNAINGGKPYAEDFNEQALCAAASNNPGPATNVAPMPTVFTTCGNGTVEAFEDCDNGASNVNGGAPGTCSTTCRLN